jgi:hypothetical protein
MLYGPQNVDAHALTEHILTVLLRGIAKAD